VRLQGDFVLKKYVCVSGYVKSAADADEHYIGMADLAKLYGVPLDDCMAYVFSRDGYYKDMIFLYPRDDGEYSLPKINT